MGKKISKRELETMQIKYDSNLREWTKLKDAYLRPPIILDAPKTDDNFLQNMSMITLNRFINKTESHISAAQQAFNQNNIHSCALHTRVLIELNSSQTEIFYKKMMAESNEEQIQLLAQYLYGMFKTHLMFIKANSEDLKSLPNEMRTFKEKTLCQIDNFDFDISQLNELIEKQHSKYSPDLRKTYNEIEQFLKQNKHYHYKESLERKEEDLDDWYKLLSDKFIHPNLDTLRKTTTLGGVFIEKNEEKSRYSFLIFLNIALSLSITNVKNLEIEYKHFSVTQDTLTEFRRMFSQKPSFDGKILELLQCFLCFLLDILNFYKTEIMPLLDLNLSSCEEFLRIHKFFMHSTAIHKLMHKHNYSAACAELSVMIEMMEKCKIKFSIPKNLKARFALFKHSTSQTSNLTFPYGGVYYESNDEIIMRLIQDCCSPLLDMWRETILSYGSILGEKEEEKAFNSAKIKFLQMFNQNQSKVQIAVSNLENLT